MRLDSEISKYHICKQKNQDVSSGNKAEEKNVYSEEPLNISRLPFLPITMSPSSNSCYSEESDESLDYHFDNEDNTFETVLTRCVLSKKNNATINAIDGMTKKVLGEKETPELFQRTLHDLNKTSPDESLSVVVSDYKTAVKPYDTGSKQSIEQTKKRKNEK